MKSFTTTTEIEAGPNPIEIRRIFTQVTPCYDFLNSLLSFRLDHLWRRWACKAVLEGNERTILDIGTGTAKLLEAFLARQQFELAAGIDLCESMLKKAEWLVNGRAFLMAGDVSETVCFKSEAFDIVSSSFTLRSLPDLNAFFREVYRILKVNGKIVLLELTRPRNPLVHFFYLPYLKIYVPIIGTLFSRSRKAYEFLANSILRFEDPEEIGGLLSEVGFRSVRVIPYHGGIATLIAGVKS